MKNIIFLILPFFIACSGYVQTNKIPDETKYFLPKQTKNSNNIIKAEELESFSLHLQNFFKTKNNVENENENEKINIYDVGIKKGYFQ